MSQRRWQPPPMKGATTEKAPALRVDEQVVRKMLKVNPDMRHGRTTFQVKRALENGESFGAPPMSQAQPTGASPGAPERAPRVELDDSVSFFLRGKAEALTQRLADLAERSRLLDEEEQRAKQTLRQQVVSFLALLDAAAVEQQGPAVLAGHSRLLATLGVNISGLLAEVRLQRGGSR